MSQANHYVPSSFLTSHFGNQVVLEQCENGHYALVRNFHSDLHLWTKVPRSLPKDANGEFFVPGLCEPIDDRNLAQKFARRKSGFGKMVTLQMGLGKIQGFTHQQESGFVFYPRTPEDAEHILLIVTYDKPVTQERVSPQQLFGNRNVTRFNRFPATSSRRHPMDVIVLKKNADTLVYAKAAIDQYRSRIDLPRKNFYEISELSDCARAAAV